MILLWLIVVLLAGGVFAWLAARSNPLLCRWISLVADLHRLRSGARSVESATSKLVSPARTTGLNRWTGAGFPQFGIHFHLAMDGLSLLLVLLTLFLGIASVLASWTEITIGVGFFHFNLLWILAGIIGVFLALDLFLFLFRLGVDAGPDVFSHRDLGP